MSHSYRKTPIIGLCSHSNKEWKSQENRKYRRIIKQLLGTKRYELPLFKEVSSFWNSPKDAMFYFGRRPELQHLMRK